MNCLKLLALVVLLGGIWGCATNEWPADELDDVEMDVEVAPKIAGEPGSLCRCDTDCENEQGFAGICVFGVCMTRASATCSAGGSSDECPTGSRCWGLNGYEGSICWPDYASYPDCVGMRDSDGSCMYIEETRAVCDRSCSSYCETTSRPEGGIGAACEGNDDCSHGSCYSNASTGWVDGYCMDFSCSEASAPCDGGGICVPGLSTTGSNICMQPCGSDGCRSGYACRSVYGHDICWPGDPCSPEHPDGLCPGGSSCLDGACVDACSVENPAGSCPDGQECVAGECTEPSPPTSVCGSWECTGADCDDIILVPGSEDGWSAEAREDGYYTAHGSSYSYLRRDLSVLVQWATCQMKQRFPGIAPLALLDLSTSAGTTPGCPSDCRHPNGTHTGNDLDTAYYQTDGDNDGQCICGDGSARCWNGRADAYSDGYQCTTEENIMNLEQQVWFMAYMAHHPGWRIVGVDDTVCDDIRERADEMLAGGDIDSTIHRRIRSLGCYSSHSSWAFHHHHLHFSFH